MTSVHYLKFELMITHQKALGKSYIAYISEHKRTVAPNQKIP